MISDELREYVDGRVAAKVEPLQVSVVELRGFVAETREILAITQALLDTLMEKLDATAVTVRH